MKKINFTVVAILTLTSAFLASGCGGTTPATPAPDTAAADLAKQGKVLYQGQDFTIAIPDKWEVISKEEFTTNYPKEIIVAFRNNVKNEIFTANMTVAIQSLDVEIPAEDFGKNSVKKQSEFVPSFKELRSSTQDLTFGQTKIPTYFIQSEGKKSTQEPLLKFAQLFVVNNKKAYTVTAAYLPTEDENVVNAINEMINSFSLK
jgi:hypothetical protein